MILGFLFASLTAHAGPAVSGGNLDVCDPEKEPLLETFFESDLALKAVVQNLADSNFSKKCAVGNTSLVKPNDVGIETSKFSVRFTDGALEYDIIVHYKAQRTGMAPGYKGHEPGSEDGTLLSSPILLKFEVIPSKVSKGLFGF